jgi:hypothetical protein
VNRFRGCGARLSKYLFHWFRPIDSNAELVEIFRGVFQTDVACPRDNEQNISCGVLHGCLVVGVDIYCGNRAEKSTG